MNYTKLTFSFRTKEAESSFFRNNLTHLQRKGQLTLMSWPFFYSLSFLFTPAIQP